MIWDTLEFYKDELLVLLVFGLVGLGLLGPELELVVWMVPVGLLGLVLVGLVAQGLVWLAPMAQRLWQKKTQNQTGELPELINDTSQSTSTERLFNHIANLLLALYPDNISESEREDLALAIEYEWKESYEAGGKALFITTATRAIISLIYDVGRAWTVDRRRTRTL